MEQFFKTLYSHKSALLFNDHPGLFKNQGIDPKLYASWSEIEKVLNANTIVETNPFELISKDNKHKLEIPIRKSLWKDRIDKKFVIDKINEGNSLVITRWEDFNSTCEEFCKNLDSLFSINSSAHVYCGLNNSKSFPIHNDNPCNFVLQVEGQTEWRVYKNKMSHLFTQIDFNLVSKHLENYRNMEIVMECILEPGDVLYIPARMYHQAIPNTKRISISFPCPLLDSFFVPIDRNYYKINY